MEIREAQGHLFELAFNAGILTAIHQTEMKYAHMGLFIDDLKKLNHRGVVNSLVQMKLKEGFIDAESQRIWATWGKLLLLRGHLGGLGLWHELMDAFGYSSNTSRYWELLYVQCCLSDATSMRTLEKNEHERYSQILTREAEPAKIYCSPVENEREPLELSFQSFTDESARRGIIDSTIINANSYPAKLIELTYKVFFETCKINEDGSLKNKLGQSARDESLVTEIIHHVSEPNSDQLLVYIQDKQRLIQLIDFVKKTLPRFDKNKAYLEIHSLSDPDKESRLECKDQVRVVFMTSSASRGISFPHAKHIIVELPRFQIENNLMEIIQTIYRGRGDLGEGKNNDREPKKVTVYIVEKVFTNVPSKQQSQIAP